MRIVSQLRDIRVMPDVQDESSEYNFAIAPAPRVRRALRGLGILYFNWEPGTKYPHLTRGLFMPSPVPAEITTSAIGGIRFSFAYAERFACSGVISDGFGDSFLVAPAFKLDVEGKDIAALLVSPRNEPARIVVAKSSLSIPAEDSDAIITVRDGDELSCGGTLTKTGASAKLALVRNSMPPMSNRGIFETIAEADETGTINGTWKPAMRNFEEMLFVFRPTDVGLEDVHEVVRPMKGVDGDEVEWGSSFVVGDGGRTSYTLRLVSKRHLRSDLVDEMQITLA